MSVATAVIVSFLLAASAPWVHRMWGRRSGWVLSLGPAALFFYFAHLAAAVWRGAEVTETIAWAPSLRLQFSFRLDGLSLLFALLITGIGALVVVYAGGYLKGHVRLGRFYATLLFFMASMLGLVLADHLIVLFIFWELTSISSYLLIGFDQERDAARAGALQALLVTGGGGLALLAGFVLLGQIAGSFEIAYLAQRADLLRLSPLAGAAVGLVLVGAFTKSAQFPFHFWLPAAMEAPAPVSCYLHAATMVKAGVYLLARLTPSLGAVEGWTATLTIIGALTMLTGAVIALFKSDLKQILAYSTVSVLGILTFLIGIGTPHAVEAMAVYLIGHGLYKGALFLVAGAVDHEAGTRDIAQLGGLWRAMPVTATAGSLAALSMAGLPPLYGFIGKELLYEAGLRAPAFAVVLVKVMVVTAILLFAVAGAVGYRPFYGRVRVAVKPPHEAPPALLFGPVVLAGCGLLLGLIPSPSEKAISYAVSAVLGEPAATVKLGLFHGVSPALLLSLLSVAGGLLIWRLQGKLIGRQGRLSLARWGPARGYELALAALNRVAVSQTRLLQSGLLRYYLLTMVVTTVALVSVGLAGAALMPNASVLAEVRWHEALLVGMILVAIMTAVSTSSRLTAVAALGAIGVGIALIYSSFGAPDLAMTQVVVETLTVILLVLVLHHLPDFSMLTPRAGRLRDGAIALAAGILMVVLVLEAASVRHAPSIASYYLENSYTLAQGRNVVNVILTDFRALDTLGEITVLAVAGMGVYSLLRLRFGKEGKQ